MSIVAEYTIDLPRYAAAVEAVPGMRLLVEQIAACDSETVSVTFWAEGGEFDTFEDRLEHTDAIIEIMELSGRLDGRKLYQIRLPAAETTYWAWTKRGGVLLECTITPAGITMRIRFPDQETLRDYRQHCKEQGCSFNLTGLQTTDAPPDDQHGRLTVAQGELLTAAVEDGYFKVPREVTMNDLAADLSISDQAASERLRRGLSNVLEHGAFDRSNGYRPKTRVGE